jgi:DNA-binding PadR family transcriptional regulator
VPRLPTTSYAILGLLSRGPKSGYDLASLAERTIAHFWPIAKSQMYGELARLERLGYVRGTAVRQRKTPDKRVFRLTAGGESALDAWLREPPVTRDRYRSAFLVKVFFGERIPAETLDDHFERYATGVERYGKELRRITTQTAGQPEVEYPRATALLGQHLTEAVALWIRHVRDDLVVHPPSPIRRAAQRRPRGIGKRMPGRAARAQKR